MTRDGLPSIDTFAPSAVTDERPDGTWMAAPEMDVQAMARAMNGRGYRLSTMTGVALPGGEAEILYHFVKGGTAVHVKTRTHGGKLPSIAMLVRAASWIEREIHDFFGVEFPGHPNLAPLMRPADLPQGFFRDDAEASGKRVPARSPSP